MKRLKYNYKSMRDADVIQITLYNNITIKTAITKHQKYSYTFYA